MSQNYLRYHFLDKPEVAQLFHLSFEALESLIKEGHFPPPIDYYGECWLVDELKEFIFTHCENLGYTRRRVEKIFERAGLLTPKCAPANDNLDIESSVEAEITKAIAHLKNTQKMTVANAGATAHPVPQKPAVDFSDTTNEIESYIAAYRRWFG